MSSLIFGAGFLIRNATHDNRPVCAPRPDHFFGGSGPIPGAHTQVLRQDAGDIAQCECADAGAQARVAAIPRVHRHHAAADWKRPPREWAEAKAQFAVMFKERFVRA